MASQIWPRTDRELEENLSDIHKQESNSYFTSPVSDSDGVSLNDTYITEQSYEQM